MNKTLWKSLGYKNGKIMSKKNGDSVWVISEWKKYDGKIDLCNSGFHASERIIDTMFFVNCEILAKVEVRGENIKEKDKQVWSEMQIVKAYKWEKKNSVALSIFAAELCLENFLKVFPDDKRPREAIEAAKKWLENPNAENESAARSAARSVARSVESARLAWSARSVESAWSAWSAW